MSNYIMLFLIWVLLLGISILQLSFEKLHTDLVKINETLITLSQK